MSESADQHILIKRRAAFWTGAALAVALVAGCGGESGSGSKSADAPQPQAAKSADSTIVIKNNDPGVTLTGPFEAISGYLQKSDRTLVGGEGSAATFRLPVTQSGFHEVFVQWPQNAPLGSSAKVEVLHDGGGIARTFDQTGDGGQWKSLGTFELKRDGAASVRIESVAGATVLVDALRLQYLGTEAVGLAVRNPNLPIAETGVGYRARIEPTGGVAPYTIRLAAGALPDGLSLDSASGTLSGIPAMAGSFEIPLAITDGAGKSVVAATQLQIVNSSAAVAGNAQPLDFSKSASAKDGAPNGTPPNLNSLLSVISAMPEGAWSKVNLNNFSDSWPPEDLRAAYGWSVPAPDRIILAWSSMAWDPNRGQIIIYGGGHANYTGNDVYLWKGATQRWERGSLSSEMVYDNLGYVAPIDGTSNAPASAHTYDNAVFLPVLDRYLQFGGASFPTGGPYVTTDNNTSPVRVTGPYLFDPARADPNKVGGTTGSHVKRVSPHPEIVGGNMWQNRENWRNATYPPPNLSFLEGCTGYRRENGKDVVYVRYGVYDLFRYTINSLTNTTQDTWERVGRYWTGVGTKAGCAVDPVLNAFVTTGNNQVPIVYWNLNTPGDANNDVRVVPSDPGGQFASYLGAGRNLSNCGMDYDPKRHQFAIWCGDGRIFMVKPPATLSPSGWVVQQQPTPTGAVPNGDVGTGILGKWKYIDNLDVFMGIQDHVQGNIWVYKPVGWQSPGGGGGGGGGGTPPPNVAPTVAITQPATGAAVAVGTPIQIMASASDSDGTVAKVEFFNGAGKIGEATSAPFQMSLASPPVGNLSLTARATDDDGAQKTSSPVTVTVTVTSGGGGGGGGGGGDGSTTSVLLQRGQNGYTQSSDTYLSNYHKSLSFGAYTLMQDYGAIYTGLTRFAIFASEGGPVPNGATIVSARVSLYNYVGYNVNYGLHPLLKAWQEGTATWDQSSPGTGWTVGGANGSGSDYGSAADATTVSDFNPGWVTFDVKSGLQRMSNATPTANYGWRLVASGGYVNALKRFYTSEYTGDPMLRPKLEITYSGGGGGGGGGANVPPTVTITQPTAGGVVPSGSPLLLGVDATDSDGTIAKVEYFNNQTKIGESTAAPFQFNWLTPPVGALNLTALATDNGGAQSSSCEIALTVAGGGGGGGGGGGAGGGGGGSATTVTLQRGQNGYTQATDTYLSGYHRSLAFGTYTLMQDIGTTYTVLTRFAIFASEGGPVPDGATIDSATVSVYNYVGYNVNYGLHRMRKNWQEGSATWDDAASGTPWAAGGASGAGSDYDALADATTVTDFSPGWVTFNVKAAVQQMSAAPTANNGWRLLATGGYVNALKRFYSSEYTGDPLLRPKLQITYR